MDWIDDEYGAHTRDGKHEVRIRGDRFEGRFYVIRDRFPFKYHKRTYRSLKGAKAWVESQAEKFQQTERL